MQFVVSNGFTSSTLRGKHIANALGVPCLFADIGTARNELVVFVKDADRGLVLDAKDRGNLIAYDPLDLYCYKERSSPFADLVDIMIVPNAPCEAFYGPLFKNARFAVIPHQWDCRISAQAPQDRVRTAYIGKGFNCLPQWDGERITNPADMIEAASRFNLHLSLNQRTDKHRLLKPSIKIATASAVLANVVAYPDPGAVELLGSDYPYFVKDKPMEAVREAIGSFGSATWKRARERMRDVRERTSLQVIAGLYARLAEKELEAA